MLIKNRSSHLLRRARHLRGRGGVRLRLRLDVPQPHRVQIPNLGPQILQRQVRLGLSQLGGRQLLLEAGDAVLGHVLSLGLNLLMLS